MHTATVSLPEIPEMGFRYLYGEPVEGTAYVVFGVKIHQEMIRLPSVKQVSNVSDCVSDRFVLFHVLP